VDALVRALDGFRPDYRLARMRAATAACDGRLAAAMVRRRLGLHARVREAAARLHSLSPLAVLGRGYAVCWTDHRTLVRTADEVAAGDHVRVTLGRGEIGCEVRDVSPSGIGTDVG
jgi:exodeoxyribonuclease VII large subunit